MHEGTLRTRYESDPMLPMLPRNDLPTYWSGTKSNGPEPIHLPGSIRGTISALLCLVCLTLQRRIPFENDCKSTVDGRARFCSLDAVRRQRAAEGASAFSLGGGMDEADGRRDS